MTMQVQSSVEIRNVRNLTSTTPQFSMAWCLLTTRDKFASSQLRRVQVRGAPFPIRNLLPYQYDAERSALSYSWMYVHSVQLYLQHPVPTHRQLYLNNCTNYRASGQRWTTDVGWFKRQPSIQKCPPTTTTAEAVCHLTTIACHSAMAEWATGTRQTSRQEVETDILNRNNIQFYTRHTSEFFYLQKQRKRIQSTQKYSSLFPPTYTNSMTQKKQELLKNPTKIEEIQGKKIIDRN